MFFDMGEQLFKISNPRGEPNNTVISGFKVR
jgi:hypothetical protein